MPLPLPLPLRASQSLEELPPRIDTPLLFPGKRGGHLNLNSWRRNEWTPALRAAGLEHRPPYALRHSFAAWSIAPSIGLFEFARMMGTSVEQIDRTYGHLLPDSIDAPGRRSRCLGTVLPLRRNSEASSCDEKTPPEQGLPSDRGAEI